MITFCLLNEGKEVLKPDHQYCICLYVGCEKYEDLAKVGQLFQNQLFDLKNNGIIDQDATSRWDMNRTWNNTVNTKCERKSPLFPAINQENYIPDELHLLLFTLFQIKRLINLKLMLKIGSAYFAIQLKKKKSQSGLFIFWRNIDVNKEN
ncbi:unnamed protein product [Rhizophagus irregularis]|uniref:Uncharacterized protein n=1 Tax=Rhizophagus irregularis TaxID=588596 RepID=A0A916DZL2_9GLOM|nr:unnamed protein product [Rhizophagus irregularis]